MIYRSISGKVYTTCYIREIENELHKVAQICIEFHGNNAWQENNLDEIVMLLKRNNYHVEFRNKIVQDTFKKTSA